MGKIEYTNPWIEHADKDRIWISFSDNPGLYETYRRACSNCLSSLYKQLADFGKGMENEADKEQYRTIDIGPAFSCWKAFGTLPIAATPDDCKKVVGRYRKNLHTIFDVFGKMYGPASSDDTKIVLVYANGEEADYFLEELEKAARLVFKDVRDELKFGKSRGCECFHHALFGKEFDVWDKEMEIKYTENIERVKGLLEANPIVAKQKR